MVTDFPVLARRSDRRGIKSTILHSSNVFHFEVCGAVTTLGTFITKRRATATKKKDLYDDQNANANLNVVKG